MTASKVTPPAEEKGVKVEVGGAIDSNCLECSYALLHLMVVASMAHITWKWSEIGKRTEKWRKILMIAKGKMSLSQVAISL